MEVVRTSLIHLLPIVHSSECTAPKSSSPSLASFQLHHTATCDKHLLVTTSKTFGQSIERQEQNSIPRLLAWQSHIGYKHKSHLFVPHDLSKLQGIACDGVFSWMQPTMGRAILNCPPHTVLCCHPPASANAAQLLLGLTEGPKTTRAYSHQQNSNLQGGVQVMCMQP